MLNTEIAALNKYLQETPEEYISGETFKHELDKPNVQSNRIADTTQDIALKLDKYKDKQEVIYLLNCKRIEALQLTLEVAPVTVAMSVLNEKERFVIEKHYFERKCWGDICDEYEDKFKPATLSTKHAQRIRDKALDMLSRLA